MPLWTTVFRKDVRQLKPLLAIFGGALLLQLPVQLGMVGRLAPDPAENAWRPLLLDGLLRLVTVVLAAKLVAFAVFEDSPTRRERFLATRPLPRRSLLAAKAAFLGLFVVAPFVAATVAYLSLSGMPARVVALGALQTALFSTAVTALGASFVVLWETRRRLATGLAAAGLALAAVIIGDSLPAMHWRPLLPLGPDPFDEPAVWFALAASAAVMTSLLAWFHLRHRPAVGWRIAAMTLVGLLAPMAATTTLAALRRPAEVAEVAPPAIVGRQVWLNRSGDRPQLSLAMTPAPGEPVDGLDTEWTLAQLAVGDWRHRARPVKDPRTHPGNLLTQGPIPAGLRHALRRELGSRFSLVSHVGRAETTTDSAWALLPERSVPSGPQPLRARFVGHRFGWLLAAELPLRAGARARDGDATWELHGFDTPPGIPLAISLTHVGPRLWLGGGGAAVPFERSGHQFFLVDGDRGLVLPLDGSHPVRSTLAGPTACPRHGLLVTLENFTGNQRAATAGSDDLRLLVFRPAHEGSIGFGWQSRGPLDLRSETLPEGKGLARNENDLEPEDIARWLADHPGPAPQAPAAEVVRYLVELLDQTNRCRRLDPGHPAVAALAAYVPAHLDLLLRAHDALAIDQHASRNLLDEALVAGLRREQVPGLGQALGHRPELLDLLARRGWTADLRNELAALVRRGRSDTSTLEAVANLPDHAGLAADELLAVFRIDPEPAGYRVLRRMPELATGLDRHVDELVAGGLPVVRESGATATLELALERGHPEAPQTLRRAITYALGLNPANGDWFAHQLTEHFDLSPLADHHGDPERILPWFLAHDPQSFRFDPDARRYRLCPSS